MRWWVRDDTPRDGSETAPADQSFRWPEKEPPAVDDLIVTPEGWFAWVVAVHRLRRTIDMEVATTAGAGARKRGARRRP